MLLLIATSELRKKRAEIDAQGRSCFWWGSVCRLDQNWELLSTDCAALIEWVQSNPGQALVLPHLSISWRRVLNRLPAELRSLVASRIGADAITLADALEDLVTDFHRFALW